MIDPKFSDDAVQIGVGRVQNLVHPMDQLHVGVATHLAEHRRTLDRLIGETIELSKEGGAFDFSHKISSLGRHWIQDYFVCVTCKGHALQPTRPA